jgi:UDP-N-acetylglucosamine/UDP-N-acetylgalactosamine diphosphorylase
LVKSGNALVLSDLPKELRQRITDHGQEHVLVFWDDLDQGEQQEFATQLESIDFEQFAMLQKQFVQQSNDVPPMDIAPSLFVSLDDLIDTESLRNTGKEIIRNGQLAVITVAGGQGTRLGWSGPKGTFPATPVTGKSLFQLIAEQIAFASEKYGVTIPWYIMTSVENDAVTRSYLLDNNCFGLERTDIVAFTQGEVPAIDAKGKMLLSSRNKVVMNPDGHGGVITALNQSGGLAELEAAGVKYLSYVQVDNPLAKVVDPVFLALHVDDQQSSVEITSKCVHKTNPNERVGVFCVVDGKTTIVEYSDLSEEQKNQTDPDDKLIFRAGSIAIHMLSTDFLQRIAGELPWHIAKKKMQYLSLETGQRIEPDEPNAYKFERFVFDVLMLASNPLIVETSREEEFAPIKNADGDDSPATSRNLQKQRAANWLQSRGVQVSESAVVEISPLSGSSPEELDTELLPEVVEDEEIVSL